MATVKTIGIATFLFFSMAATESVIDLMLWVANLP